MTERNSPSANARVSDLVPGDVVESLGERWCFLGRMPSPLFEGLALVIWRGREGQVSLDNLDSRQVVGSLEPVDSNTRRKRLEGAMFGEGRRW